MAAAAAEAERSIVDVTILLTSDRRHLLESPKANAFAFRLFEMLPMMPRFTVEIVKQELSTSYPTANSAVKLLTDLGIVAEMTGQQTYRTFGYRSYIELLARSE